MIAGAVFDLDGTLVDSVPDIAAAASAMLAARDAEPLAREEAVRFVGAGVAMLVERCLRARSLPAGPADVAAGVADFRRHYDAAPAVATRPFPGVVAALEALHAAGLPLALCTNKPEAPARALLAALDLARFFPVVIGGDTVGALKPDPAPLRAAAEGIGAGTAIAFVGDSETDEATAAALRVPFALFTGGYRKKPVSAFAAALTYDDPARLVDWLRTA